MMILTKWEDEPQFANLEYIIQRESTITLVAKPWITLYYDSHYAAYAVKESNQPVQVVSLKALFDHKPLHAVKSFTARSSPWFVVTRFKLA